MNKVIIIILCCLSTLKVSAQNITGTVIDENSLPLQSVSIILLSQKDSTMLKGTITDKLGHFNIPAPGKAYIVKVSFIGYKTLYLNSKEKDMGTIQLKEYSKELESVVVKGKRPIVKVGLNKVETYVANSYLKYLGKVTDILGKIPGLTKNLQLLGGGSPTFVLNGKPVSLKELSAIPSSEVKKIVVDSNPTVEYSASSKGVVYITTTKSLENTLSTDISNTSLFARNYMNMNNVTINEKYKNVSNLLTAGFSYLNTTQIDKTTEKVFLPNSNIESSKERHTRGQGRSFDWFYSMNWDITKRQTLGIQYYGNVNNVHVKEPTWQTMNGEEMDFVQRKRGTAYMHYVGLNYRYDIEKNSTLQFVADYAHQNSEDTCFANATPAVSTNSNGRYNVGGAILSYNKNAKWGKYSAGVFASTIGSNGGYAYNEYGENYKTHETLYGAYASYSKQIKKYSVQLGVRLEADKRKLESTAEGIIKDSTEWKVFPNMVITRSLTDNSSIGFSVGQTISRPTFNSLNPSINYYDAISYKVGNPLLNSCVATEYKLSYNIGNLMTSVSYNHSKNMIIDLPFWSEMGIDNKNIVWKPVNFDKASSLVAIAIYYYSLGPIQGNVTGSYTKPYLKADYLGEKHSWNKSRYYFSMSAQYPLTQRTLFAIDGSFDSACSSMMVNHRSSWTLNFTFMQQLLKDKLTLLVMVNDIFHSNRGNTWTMGYQNIRTTMDTNGDTQYILVKLNYNLGKLKLDNTKKSASKEMLDRL